jgi:hypothetical protein
MHGPLTLARSHCLLQLIVDPPGVERRDALVGVSRVSSVNDDRASLAATAAHERVGLVAQVLDAPDEEGV